MYFFGLDKSRKIRILSRKFFKVFLHNFICCDKEVHQNLDSLKTHFLERDVYRRLFRSYFDTILHVGVDDEIEGPRIYSKGCWEQTLIRYQINFENIEVIPRSTFAW